MVGCAGLCRSSVAVDGIDRYGSTNHGSNRQQEGQQVEGKRLAYSEVPANLHNSFQKGFGYHLDLLIVGLLIVICSMLGLPYFVAATILSIAHVQSLRMESETAAPGEKPMFLGVR